MNAIHLRNDAAIGRFAGALYGASAIPERWLHPLAWRNANSVQADQLVTLNPPSSGGS